MGRNSFITLSPHHPISPILEGTMKTYFILSAIGTDRPGIVADVSEVIYGCGGNIEDSSMTLLRKHFALLLLFSTEREEVNQKLSFDLKRLEWDKNLTVFFSPITLEEAHSKTPEQTDRFKITTSGIDHAGIVCKVCRLLADSGINIIDMETHRIISAESGTPIFEMDVDIEVPRSLSEEGLRNDLHRLADELMIDLVLRRI
ncbi:MAG: ACT domain-containing protein [Thermodesulfobacteriota bacterium]|nr:ACT domain-containing protein [Thermodesulfobacteriota bacterium]